MATAHLIKKGLEVRARTMVMKRHVNVESVVSWWRVACKALGDVAPSTYRTAEIERDYIRFVVDDTTIVMVDRKRAML